MLALQQAIPQYMSLVHIPWHSAQTFLDSLSKILIEGRTDHWWSSNSMEGRAHCASQMDMQHVHSALAEKGCEFQDREIFPSSWWMGIVWHIGRNEFSDQLKVVLQRKMVFLLIPPMKVTSTYYDLTTSSISPAIIIISSHLADGIKLGDSTLVEGEY